MSVSAGINIDLMQKHDEVFPFSLEILQTLTSTGWSLFRSGKVSYMPLGDNEFLEYRYGEIIEYEKFLSIIEKKEQARELIAVDLFWGDTLIGGTFIFYPSKNYRKISISVSSERQVIRFGRNYTMTNFQWYLEKLLPPLNEVFGVEHFLCEQHG